MKFRTVFAIAMLGAGLAWAQSSIVMNTVEQTGGVPVPELTRLNTLITNVNNLYSTFNTLQRAYNRYTFCANLGMAYAPNPASVLPGWVSDTSCAPLPNQPLAREIILTTATADGDDMSGYGATAKARIEGFMDANGCPTAKWHPCTDHEIRYLYGRHPKMFSANVTASAWFMGIDADSAARFSTGTPVANPYCTYWSSNVGSGYLLTYDDGTGLGMIYGNCASAYRVACCR